MITRTMSIEEAISESQRLFKAGVIRRYVLEALVNDNFTWDQASTIVRWAERSIKE